MRPKRIKIAPSKIPGAGLGLYLMEEAKRGEFVAGESITQAANATRSDHYRIKISKNLCLDGEPSHRFDGNYINDGKCAELDVNV